MSDLPKAVERFVERRSNSPKDSIDGKSWAETFMIFSDSPVRKLTEIAKVFYNEIPFDCDCGDCNVCKFRQALAALEIK